MPFSFFGRKQAAPKQQAPQRSIPLTQRGGPASLGHAVTEPHDRRERGGLRLEVGTSGIDPCVEHAAILFAAARPAEASAVLEAALAQGDASEECWMMLGELFELAGDLQRAKALAQRYTVHFKKPPPHRRAPGEHSAAPQGLLLSGEIVGAGAARFAFLLAASGAELEIDASGLQRIDFVSAGFLLNTMLALQQAGKRVRIRHLSHLVAGLLASVGMGRLAVLETR